jgi:hypothetical protein
VIFTLPFSVKFHLYSQYTNWVGIGKNVDSLFTWATGLTVLTLFALVLFQSYWALGGTRFLSGAWGGKYTVLPRRLRISSAISVLLFALAIALVLVRVQAWNSGLSTTSAAWGTLAFVPVFLLSSIANFASQSKSERYLNAPASLLLAAMLLFITLNGHQDGVIPSPVSFVQFER